MTLRRRALAVALGGSLATLAAAFALGRVHRPGRLAGEVLETSDVVATPLAEADAGSAPLATPGSTFGEDRSAGTASPTEILSPRDVVEVAAGEVRLRARQGTGEVEIWRGGALLFRLTSGRAGAGEISGLAYRRAAGDAWRHLTALRAVEALSNGRRLIFQTDELDAVATLDVTAVAEGVLRGVFRPPVGSAVAGTALAVAADPAELLLGLGERFDGVALGGRRVELWAADRREVGYGASTYLPVPWLLSSRGYGFLLDDPRRSVWDLRAARPEAWTVELAGPTLAFLVVAGPPARAIERLTALTGRPRLPPPLAFGVVKCLIGGETRVLTDAARLKRAGIPVDGIFVFDATDDAANVGWPFVTYDPIPAGTYSDVRRLTASLRRYGYHPLAYLSPDFRPDRASFRRAKDLGYLVRARDGTTWTSPRYGIGLIDVTNPAAVAWWQNGPLRRALIDLDFDGGMLDLGEAVPDDARFGDRDGSEVHNLFPVVLASAMEAGLRALKPDGTFWMRSGYTGGQRYQRGTWSGDPLHSWEPDVGLPSVLSAGLSAGLAGYPFWHTEVGGYVDAGLDPASERELYLRWLQFGAFTTMLRDNYGDRRGHPTDVWTDAETLRLWRRYAKLHQALKPYLLRAAQQSVETGLPLLRHLALAFPEDRRSWSVETEYLLGDDLLVAPVVTFGARTQHAYLPTSRWQHWWTGVVYTGPADVEVPAPVAEIPVFVRVGAPSPLPDPATV